MKPSSENVIQMKEECTEKGQKSARGAGGGGGGKLGTSHYVSFARHLL